VRLLGITIGDSVLATAEKPWYGVVVAILAFITGVFGSTATDSIKNTFPFCCYVGFSGPQDWGVACRDDRRVLAACFHLGRTLWRKASRRGPGT
jgi:hypothetical protein